MPSPAAPMAGHGYTLNSPSDSAWRSTTNGWPGSCGGRDPGPLPAPQPRLHRADPQADPVHDLVDRDFVVDGPNEIWCTDITEHPTREPPGKVRSTAPLSSTCSPAESSAGRSATTCAPNS